MRAPVTVVSGGAGLIGSACIEALTERGHTCVALDPGVPTRMRAGEHVRCDVASERSVRAAIARVMRRHGRIDHCVHGPSLAPRGFGAELADYDVAVWRRVLDVHVTGAMLLARAVVPPMARRGSGSLVFLGSIYGLVAPRFGLYGRGRTGPPLVYTASKSALVGMAKWIAARYGRAGVRCNVVSPGGVDESPWPTPQFKRRYAAEVPLGHPVAVADVARAIVYALEAPNLTGHNLVLDGGWTSV